MVVAGEYGYMEPIIYTGKQARLLFKLIIHLKEAPEFNPSFSSTTILHHSPTYNICIQQLFCGAYGAAWLSW
jgi:hypothetical protein